MTAEITDFNQLHYIYIEIQSVLLRGNINTEVRAGASSVKELQEQTKHVAPI